MDIHELSKLTDLELKARTEAIEAELATIRELLIFRAHVKGEIQQTVEQEALKIFKEHGRNPAIVFYCRQLNCSLKEGLDAVRRITGEH